MSVLFRRCDRDGKVHCYFVPFDPFAVAILIVFALGIMFSGLIAFRSLVYQSPLTFVLTIAIGFVVGFGSFGIAKLSVIRKGTWFSIGSKLMSDAMRRCYRFGYFAMGCASLLASLFAIVA